MDNIFEVVAIFGLFVCLVLGGLTLATRIDENNKKLAVAAVKQGLVQCQSKATYEFYWTTQGACKN